MASIAVINAVKARLTASFTGAEVFYPNGAIPSALPHVAVQFPVANEEQASFGAPGANVFREEGAIRFVITVEWGEGHERAGSLASSLRNLFRNARFDGVRCYAPTTPVFNERSEEGGQYAVSLAVPYDFDIFA